MNTLDQARYLHDKGYEIDVFTLEKGGVLDQYIPEYIRVIDVPDIDKLHAHYDLIIGRQWPLLEYILFTQEIDASRIYFECASWKLPIDFYPYFYQELTLCGYISKRIKNTLAEMGYDTSDSFYFPNYTRAEFIEYGKRVKEGKSTNSANAPQKIAIVSNHVPEELVTAAEILRTEHSIDVELYGMNHEYQLITPEILGQYDVIVSMGKTSFFSLSMGIPSYLYDQTCSIGYVGTSNYESCVAGNLAGSDGYRKKTPKELADDILAGYTAALEQSDELARYAERDFLFEDQMERFLAELMTRPEIDMNLLREKYPFARYLSPVFINEADFDRRDILRWYESTMKLGSMLQESEQRREELVNSKGWQLLELLRKPLHLLKGRKEPKD